jgi:hypothetical protein
LRTTFITRCIHPHKISNTWVNEIQERQEFSYRPCGPTMFVNVRTERDWPYFGVVVECRSERVECCCERFVRYSECLSERFVGGSGCVFCLSFFSGACRLRSDSVIGHLPAHGSLICRGRVNFSAPLSSGTCKLMYGDSLQSVLIVINSFLNVSNTVFSLSYVNGDSQT